MLPFLVALDDLKPWFKAVYGQLPGVDFRFCRPDPAAMKSALTSDVVAIASEDLPPTGADLAALRWVHLLSAGYDSLLGRALPKPGLLITNSSGAYTDGIAEFVLMRMLMHARQAEALAEAQRQRTWARDQFGGTTLRGKRLLVVGNGSVGSETGRLGAALGMQVRVAGRADRAALPELAADADYVVVAAALNPSSRGLIGRAVFARLQRKPYLVNISRGALIDTAALLEALESGRLSGAALDVFDSEPLPPDSPLYGARGVSISPHISGVFDEVYPNLVEVLVRNLACFLRGEALPNRIDLSGGPRPAA